MVRGAFRSFAHDHRFESRDGGTVMTDEINLWCEATKREAQQKHLSGG
jgi:ligand-binding SRPBCC domain-containing protein